MAGVNEKVWFSKETGTRIASSAVLAPPVLLATWYGDPWFSVLCTFIFTIILWEWHRICKNGLWDGLIVHRAGWFIGGTIYISIPIIMLILIRSGDVGRETVVWLMICVWAADTGAYVIGRSVGGPKLAPRISPNKTYSGLIGAICFSSLVGVELAMILSSLNSLSVNSNVVNAAALGAAIGIFSQIGDLLESNVKRFFKIKDASGLIPGHGGLMDRVDGLLAATFGIFISLCFFEGPLNR